MWGYIILFAILGLIIVGLVETSKDNKRNATMAQTGHSSIEYLGGSPHIDSASTVCSTEVIANLIEWQQDASHQMDQYQIRGS